MRILIMGLPGSGKTTVSKRLAAALNATHINADSVRTAFDWDFSYAGRLRQATRMRELSEKAPTDHVVADFVAPLKLHRDIFCPDVLVFLNTINISRYKDTNTIFQDPTGADFQFNTFREIDIEVLANYVKGQLK